MTTYRTGVEFSTNVGVLERDYQRAAQASGVFGEKAQRDLAGVTVAQDKVALAAQRVVAADSQLRASRERLNAVMASGVATQRELAAAQSSFVASQDRLIAAQSRQTAILREQQTAQATAGRTPLGRPGGGTVGLVAGFAATAAAIKIKDAVESGARAAAGLQAIDRQLGATLASTGNAANTSVEGIDANAESISKQTGISEEATRAGSLLALTFTQVRNQGDGAAAIFDRTQRTAANMAIGLHLARGGAIDFQGAVRQLARALNDPVAGMTLLTRSGVSFTRQQREQIKALGESGHMLQAQQMILDLVNQKFSNAASNYGNTAAGAYDQAREAVDQLERSLAAPVLSTGVPVLHALRDTVEFLVAHPATLHMGELAVGLTGAAFAAATLERGVRFLRSSEWLTALGRTVFGYRSLGRAVTTLAGEEDTEALAAARQAEAHNAVTAAVERQTVAMRGLSAANVTTAETGAASTVTGPAAGAGLFRRGLGVVGRAAGVIGLGDIAAEIVGPHLRSGGIATAYHLGQANSLIDQLHALTGSQFQNANILQRRAVAGIYNTEAPGALKAANGGRGDLVALARVITDVRNAYAQYATTASNAEVEFGQVRSGQHELADIYANQRDAIYQADLADANATQHRADRLNHLFRQARQLQAGVVAGNAKAITTIEGMIGASQAGMFDLVDPNAEAAKGKAASAAAAVGTASTSATIAQRSVVLAEARLATLRANSKATAYQLQSAESSLANARDRAAGASDRLTTAEKKTHDAQSSSLSLADVLKRATAQDANAQSLAVAAHRMAQLGVQVPVMQALLQLDQQAPGTFARVAAHLTKAGADELNRDHRIANAARRSLEEAFADSNTGQARRRAAHAGTLAAQAWELAYRAALKDPKFWDLVNTDLGGLLIGNLRVLPKGNPGATGPGDPGRAPSLPNLLYPIPTPRSTTPHGLAGGGWTRGAPGQVSPDYVHGGEYVLSRDMLAGRQPIGVSLGAVQHAPTAAQQVVVHVHTAAPVYSTNHQWHNTIKASSPREFEAWADGQARVRSVTP